MRTDCSYFEGKLKLLHQRRGIDALKSTTKDDEKRNWFRGYYTYPQKEAVMKWFNEGSRPLSCFILDNDFHCVHIAISRSDCLGVGSNKDDVTYVTFDVTHDLVKHEAGVHFCQFNSRGENISCKNKNEMVFTHYALMLPYNFNGSFLDQYTLVYHDWEVLICEGNDNPVKAKTPISNELFGGMLSR